MDGRDMMNDMDDELKEQDHPSPERPAEMDSGESINVHEEVADRPDRPLPTSEWTAAALAHASVLLTLTLALAGGVGALVGLAVPLVIYLSYRDRSRFITFHALQSLVYQGAGMLMYIVLAAVLVAAVTAAWTISGLLSTVLVGFLLMPLALVITGVMVIALLGVPLMLAGYGVYAAYRVYQGEDFRYWLLGEWLEKEVLA
jgi:uncharacterized Tic20 family protein